MTQPGDPCNLQELLDRIRARALTKDHVSAQDILQSVGERSFGPLILVAGLITVAPLIGDIPGVPTLLAIIVLLTLSQRLCQRRSIWLPQKLARRSLPQGKLLTGLDWAEKPARFIDGCTRQRMPWLVTGVGQYLMVFACILVALAMPLMELIPFSANGGGLALMAFGLAIVARDGLLALIAIAATTGTGWFIVTNLPW
ncbi:exopolysaccharide biosynthesis protein [Marinobacter persicus]|uniref:Exopolysaccharide synthesis, ExoD n=1 Tax=Marinobacter persicus TaxID=930118 RepID=A0A2S6GAR2_9GAMM|nr:exopolysaccharide biosynthesis protein [Marinobacter persicus]PPK53617.1 hypothetical protein BY455_101130 [Marinobacter persicus]PPK56431.1 hypothetical protein B0H24_1001130 [Marinobacter persicus]PPK60004.1 hypothetical protein BY454_101130 [Marinobacter persicus]